ncbi:MAG: phosphate acetyltransferase [Nanoarchaeota archaeon]|nr:phosphate acetyltransferase [Nanoarchaeota archaeon]
MNILDKIKKEAKKLDKLIVFPEGTESRIIKASKIIGKEKIARVLLLKKGSLEQRFNEAISLLNSNEADGIITGANHSTALTLKLSFQVKKGLVSGAFLMILKNRILWFADCAVVPEPDEKQLAKIALDSAKEFENLTKMKAKVALLSFSTKGSSKDKSLDRVRNALKLVKDKLVVDGELQVDAALIPEVAKTKDSKIIKGDANVLIFPDLNSGNIGYKLVQRLGDAKAIGPILQNLKKPVNDLSRGCSVQDIVDLTAITAVQAK